MKSKMGKHSLTKLKNVERTFCKIKFQMGSIFYKKLKNVVLTYFFPILDFIFWPALLGCHNNHGTTLVLQ